MQRFAQGQGTHADWRTALGMAIATLESDAPAEPTLGWCYLTDHHASAAHEMLAVLHARFPGAQWVGTVGIGVCASGVEFFDEPAVVLLLSDLPREHFRVFSGRTPLPDPHAFRAHVAQVHADPATPDLAELIGELSARVQSGYLFGGLASTRTRTVQLADEVFEGGLCGVAFDAGVDLISRVTQGCAPVGPTRRITEAERNVVIALDDEPALDVLLADLGVDESQPRQALPKLRATLVGLSDARDALGVAAHAGAFGEEVRVRHLIGLDPQRRGVAVADAVEAGQRLAFCRRDVDAARRDLIRICAELRSELEPDELSLITGEPALAIQTEGRMPNSPNVGRRIVGALYATCTGRGGPHFGAPSAELQILRSALGDVPLAGFFAAGEIGHRHLYGYTGVLTVFTAQP
ncbi:MAG TPA: FIST N-terminal domain-containing protein [Burkholderiaceae bacterium]|nr:FIST N-terminal domain-containing protein [Burkholderiaceae bacterium]